MLANTRLRRDEDFEEDFDDDFDDYFEDEEE